ncbi:MAG: hypothetical protein K0S33_1455 [Bacteroidetes bacterium]|jgi:hypothetical protein|nr:hypothetical protein [Bacteroidota bacterium]
MVSGPHPFAQAALSRGRGNARGLAPEGDIGVFGWMCF